MSKVRLSKVNKGVSKGADDYPPTYNFPAPVGKRGSYLYMLQTVLGTVIVYVI